MPTTRRRGSLNTEMVLLLAILVVGVASAIGVLGWDISDKFTDASRYVQAAGGNATLPGAQVQATDANDDGTYELSWPEGIPPYTVLRSQNADMSGATEVVSDTPSTSATDTPPPGDNYYRVVDTAGAESAIVHVLVYTPPGNLAVTAPNASGQVSITWTDGTADYTVYRSPNADMSGAVIVTTTSGNTVNATVPFFNSYFRVVDADTGQTDVVHVYRNPATAVQNGTQANPWLVYDMPTLDAVRTHMAAGQYSLQIRNIDASETAQAGKSWNNSGAGWRPIPWNTDNLASGAVFRGTYDGGGYTISNLYINEYSNANSAYAYGLFGKMGVEGTIKNVRLVNANIRAGYQNGGTLLGLQWGGLVENCSAEGTLTSGAGNGYIGGLIGTQWGQSGSGTGVATVRNSYARVYNTGYNRSGGLIGQQFMYANATNCYAAGYTYATTLSGKVQGGLIAAKGATGTTVSNSYYDSQVSGCGDNTGKGTPQTTAQMKTASTFAAWDTTNVWNASTGFYPTLR